MDNNVTQERARLQSKVHAFVKGGSQDVAAFAADCRKLGVPVTDARLAEIVSDTRRCIREVRISAMVSRIIRRMQKHRAVSKPSIKEMAILSVDDAKIFDTVWLVLLESGTVRNCGETNNGYPRFSLDEAVR